MGRNAVIELLSDDFTDNLPLKKICLLFDEIHISDLDFFKIEILRGRLDTPIIKRELKPVLSENLSQIDFLVQNKILHNYGEHKILNSKNILAKELFNQGAKAINDLFDSFEDSNKTWNHEKYYLNDYLLRIDAAILSIGSDAEYYPILRSKKTFNEGDKKEHIFHMILKNMPEPDESVSWEQIMDFRSDEEARLKYLALINWTNEIAKSKLSVSEIKDKYEYLYLAYKKSYERHKIKSTFKVLEILAGAGISFFAADIPMTLNLVSNFFKIGISTLNLLEEEENLPGKEIAYIYHSNKKFIK